MFWKSFIKKFTSRETLIFAFIVFTLSAVFALVAKVAVDFNPVGRRMLYGLIALLLISIIYQWFVNIRVPFGRARRNPKAFEEVLKEKKPNEDDVDFLEKHIYGKGLASVAWITIFLIPVILIAII